MTGEYRRVFAYNPAWKGRHVFIRFDGVMYGYSLSLNGRTVGEADSAYNLHQFDITEFLKAGENVLDVTVVTDNAFAGFDQCDDWSFGGIQRDVDIFTLGDAYIEDVAFRSRIDAADDADIELRVSLGAFGEFPEGARLNAFIADREWRHVADFTAEAKSGETVFRARLEQPALWTAETPVLHNLVVELAAGDGSVIQRSAECVGIREVRVDGKRILVNNRPVKLHGVCLNEIDPVAGRAFGYADFHRRMELMKRCQAVEDAILSGVDHYEADNAFHQYIAASTHNRVLSEMIPIINYSVQLFTRFKDPKILRDTIRTHRAIAESICANDAAAAEKNMRKHIEANLECIKELKDNQANADSES